MLLMFMLAGEKSEAGATAAAESPHRRPSERDIPSNTLGGAECCIASGRGPPRPKSGKRPSFKTNEGHTSQYTSIQVCSFLLRLTSAMRRSCSSQLYGTLCFVSWVRTRCCRQLIDIPFIVIDSPLPVRSGRQACHRVTTPTSVPTDADVRFLPQVPSGVEVTKSLPAVSSPSMGWDEEKDASNSGINTETVGAPWKERPSPRESFNSLPSEGEAVDVQAGSLGEQLFYVQQLRERMTKEQIEMRSLIR